MIVSAYQTKITQHYNEQKIMDALKRAQVQSPFPVMKTPAGNTLRNTVMITPHEDYNDIPSFTQPIVLEEKGKQIWVVDGRSFMRYNRPTDTMVFVAENDWSFQCARVALMQVFETANPALVTRLGKIPAKAFIRWITLNLAQRFNLDMETQMRVSVFVAYYYYQMLMSDTNGEWDNENLQALASTVSNVTGVPSSTVLDIITPVGSLHTIDHLVTALEKHTGSLRLQTLNYTGLYTILSTSWVGVHSRENVGVALEHPATLVALLYTAAGEKSFRKTLLSKRMETTGRAGELDQFVKYVYSLVESKFE